MSLITTTVSVSNMKPWMIMIIVAGIFWGTYAVYNSGIAFPTPKPDEIFEYCYSTDDSFVICKLKER